MKDGRQRGYRQKRTRYIHSARMKCRRVRQHEDTAMSACCRTGVRMASVVETPVLLEFETMLTGELAITRAGESAEAHVRGPTMIRLRRAGGDRENRLLVLGTRTGGGIQGSIIVLIVDGHDVLISTANARLACHLTRFPDGWYPYKISSMQISSVRKETYIQNVS